ncbi:unnamed protein product [Gongylonema pulchrum]|uniref:PAS domain-containing protein n=1 Tax=Gongylonema pulchrum TaxID=637853 RepID=A0A183DRP9_9BILA|nr:unnamed protein product [Gongylonema pulchrum]
MINKISASDTVADHYSVFYTPIHSPFPNFFAALSFFPPVSPGILSASFSSSQLQTPAQNPPTPASNKKPTKVILIVDSKTTEILIAHSNVKRLLGLSYEQMIGRQLTEVFSSNSDDKPPVIAYSELFHPDGQLKSVYGKAVCPFRKKRSLLASSPNSSNGQWLRCSSDVSTFTSSPIVLTSFAVALSDSIISKPPPLLLHPKLDMSQAGMGGGVEGKEEGDEEGGQEWL